MRMDAKSSDLEHSDVSDEELENGTEAKDIDMHKKPAQNGRTIQNVKSKVAADSEEELGDVEFPCGICNKEVNDNDEAILCESGCSYWYHRTCTGITLQAYQMLTNEDNAEWVCDKCIATRSIPAVKLKY